MPRDLKPKPANDNSKFYSKSASISPTSENVMTRPSTQKSLTLTAVLLLVDYPQGVIPYRVKTPEMESSPSSESTFEPIQNTSATPGTNSLVGALADGPMFPSDWKAKVTSSSTVANPSTPVTKKNSFDKHDNPIFDSKSPSFVYLLTRTYLQNWLHWAAAQTVPPGEEVELKKTLKIIAEMHELECPPSCRRNGSPERSNSFSSFEEFNLSANSSPDDPNSSSQSKLTSKSKLNYSEEDRHALSSNDLLRSHSFSVDGHCDNKTPPRSKGTHNKFSNRSYSNANNKRYNSKSTFHNPGPLDSIPLSILGYPLLLRPHVVIGKGTFNQQQQQSPRGRNRSRENPGKLRRSRSFSLGKHSPSEKAHLEEASTKQHSQRLGCCAVPEPFYELLRSIHGVRCEDGITVSFQPTPGSFNIALHHHVITSKNIWKNRPLSPRAAIPHHHVSSANIRRPKSSLKSKSDAGAREITNSFLLENLNHPITLSIRSNSLNRPVEFKRRVIMNSTNCATVEIYPIKLIYSLIDDFDKTELEPPLSPSGPSVVSDATSSQNLKSNGEKNSLSLLRLAANSMTASNKNTTRPKRQKPPRVGDNNSASPYQRNRSKNPKDKQHYSHESTAASHPPKGFLLASRTSPALEALQELTKAVAPDKSSSCVRIWTKIGQHSLRKDVTMAATAVGDGFELLCLSSLNSDMTVAEFVKIHNGFVENTKSLEILVETRSSPTKAWVRQDLELSRRIQTGDYIDAQDSTGKWYESIVREVAETYIIVHYMGWSSRWDTRIPRYDSPLSNEKQKMLSPPVPLWSRTHRWRSRIRVSDKVEVREASSLVNRPKWFIAIVREIGREKDPPRDVTGGAHLETMEPSINDVSKKLPLLLLGRTRQVLVEVPQEKFNTSAPLPQTQKTYAPQPPYLRWVNLYGEELSDTNTHISTKAQHPPPATITYHHDPTRPPVEIMRSFNNIHGAGFIRESLRGVPPAPGSVGLHNLGNSCFLNSILQCLNHIEPLTKYFLRGDYREDLNTKNPLGSGGRVALTYAALLNDMWGGEYSTLAPRLLKQTVASFAPQFNNIYQHDSQEFCSFLMDGLHEDLNRVKNKPYVEEMEGRGLEDDVVATESWRKHLLRHDSTIVDYCQGMHRSHLTCPDCGNESVKFDIYSSISLPLPAQVPNDTLSLSDCIDQYTQDELLDERNAWYCSECKQHVCARKRITLWNTPDILILHLKRFTYGRRKGGVVRNKIDHKVIFPVDNFDMSKYVMMNSNGDEDSNMYKLFGVSEHTGSTANSGHYTATVRNSCDGKWYRYNDSHVGSSSGDASITGGAYLLFYQRAKGCLRWAGMERFMKMNNIDPYGSMNDGADELISAIRGENRSEKNTNESE